MYKVELLAHLGKLVLGIMDTFINIILNVACNNIQAGIAAAENEIKKHVFVGFTDLFSHPDPLFNTTSHAIVVQYYTHIKT